MIRKHIVLWTLVAAAVAAGIAMLVIHFTNLRPRLTTLQGAVMSNSENPQHQEPIAGALITATHGTVSASTHSDTSGYFRLTFPQPLLASQALALKFSQSGYHPLRMDLKLGSGSQVRQLIVAKMEPVQQPTQPVAGKAAHVVSNVRVRYSETTHSEQNIGSAARVFQVVNKANLPCGGQGPCSPDGRWKANTASVKLDAGLGNTFRDVRASCIAGPCPFTRLDTHGFAHGGRRIQVTALDWSDTATFLVEAEVFRTSIDSSVRESYPVVFDRTLSFTLPESQEGVSLRAEIDGTPMLFPLGPDIFLDWATCDSRTNRSTNSLVYQCQLKPDYRFAPPAH